MLYDQFHKTRRYFAVDCVIFGYQGEQLKLLLFKRKLEPAKGQWSLIGGWVKEDESTEGAAHRVLQVTTGLKDIYQEQVYTFSHPSRDPGGNVVTVAYYALINIDEKINELIEQHGAQWFPLNTLPQLIFDHSEIVEKALDKLRFKATYELIGKQLLAEKFTLSQLRRLYNEIFQTDFDPGNFRKKVMSLKVLEKTNEKDMSESRKGAFYFKFIEEDETQEKSGPIFKRSI